MVRAETAWTAPPTVQPCLRCGRDASGQRLRVVTISDYPLWIWLLLPLLVFPTVLLYYTLRASRQMVYSLCRSCARVRVAKQMGAVLLWAAFVAAIVAAVDTGSWVMWTGIAFYLFFIAAFATGACSHKLVRRNRLSFRPREELAGFELDEAELEE